jgi:hypothetical protein
VFTGDPRRTDTYLKADITPATCVIVEETAKRSLRRILEAIRDAGAALVYVIGIGRGDAHKHEEELRAIFPEVNYLPIAELFGQPLLIEFSRSLTRLKVQQYQRFFNDADRVLILLHNDPDPDAMASGLALRNVLRRTKQTAVIGAQLGATRPENLRMQNLLDIQVEIITGDQLADFDRIAMVDVQPHYFGPEFHRVDLVIDHHPEQPGYSAVFKDIRPHYGSTSTILTEHLRAVDEHISERTATAMLYAIKSDTLFFNRQANRVDLEAFSYLYPLADAAMIGRWKGRKSRWTALSTCSRRSRTDGWSSRSSARSSVPRRARISSLRRRFLPAARGRQVDDRGGHRQRFARDVSPQSRLLAQRG